MKAVRYDRYGPPEVLYLAEEPDPVPADDEVLVRVRATTVNRTDCGFRQGRPRVVRFVSGLRRPRRPVLGSLRRSGRYVRRRHPGADLSAVGRRGYRRPLSP